MLTIVEHDQRAARRQGGAQRCVRGLDKGAVVGVRTGEYQDGVAVYRLPTITVSVKRSEELAKMAREQAIASNARQ
ncbi:MAG: hypothetical protein IT518_24370 [Burkholderiales bacterium]|nr:hypothetical protein [Burkholderiales bacterium]